MVEGHFGWFICLFYLFVRSATKSMTWLIKGVLCVKFDLFCVYSVLTFGKYLDLYFSHFVTLHREDPPPLFLSRSLSVSVPIEDQ